MNKVEEVHSRKRTGVVLMILISIFTSREKGSNAQLKMKDTDRWTNNDQSEREKIEIEISGTRADLAVDSLFTHNNNTELTD